MKVTEYNYNTEELEEVLTRSVGVFIDFLHQENYIDEEQHRDLALNTAIILRKPSFFSSLWSKLGREDKEKSSTIVVVRQYSIKEDE